MIATRVVKVDIKHIDEKIIKDAVEVLERGGLVIFPTETVYGVAANLLNKKALDRLSELKDRPDDKQFSLHIADKGDIDKYAIDVLPRAHKVIEKFMPGPLTIVLAAPHGKSVGLRMPDHEVALRLLSRADFPVVASSANFQGKPSPKTAQEALEDFRGQVEFAIDSGPAAIGVESTVVDCRVLPFKVLREGFIKKEDFLKVADKKTVLFVCTGNSCRSVMAEYLLKKKIQEARRQDIDVVSAGTMAFVGMGPTHETVKLIQDIGMDASGHHAQRATNGLIKSSDIILTMERRHKEELLRFFPQAAPRIHVLGEFLNWESVEVDITDPIGRTEEFYKGSFLKISRAVDKLAGLL